MQEVLVQEVSVCWYDILESVTRDPRQALMTMRRFQRGWAWGCGIQWAQARLAGYRQMMGSHIGSLDGKDDPLHNKMQIASFSI